MPSRSPIAERLVLIGVASLLWAGHVESAAGSLHAGTFSPGIGQSELDLHVTGNGHQWMAFNRWQGLMGIVDDRGFEIRGPLPDFKWHQRFEPIGYGRGAGSLAFSDPQPGHHTARSIEWHTGAAVIQYVHGEEGLRQNFIINERLPGTTTLRVRMGSTGDLEPFLLDEGTVSFRDTYGQSRFLYHDLKAWDSSGKVLRAWMELGADEGRAILTIAIDDAGAVYPITIDPVSSTANTLLTGAGGFEFGIGVATAGDLNRDGYSDVVVGAWQASLGQATEGAAYVYYGSSTGIPLVAGIILQCDQAGAQMGCAVSTAGDVNGDGYSDLLVGARTWESAVAEISEGAVFVYYGSATGVAAVPNLTLESNHANDNFGSNVACAGDINNDGYSDILVGAYLAEYPTYQEGAVWVYNGSAAGLNPVNVHRLERNTSAVHFGRSISSAGDVNGDGFSDVIIGAPDWLNVNPDAGAAFVYYGSAGNLGVIMNPAPALTLLGSTVANGSFGWSVTCAGDVNGDGYSDVAVGAYLDVSGQTGEGTVRVFHGSAAGLNTVAATVIESNQTNAWLGRWVSNAGDMNGDGYSDLIVGVEQWTNPEALEGAGFLYFGSSVGIPTTVSMTFELNAAGANFGGAVCTAGDVNGDGYSDMILGARIYGLGGAAAVYHGGPYSVNTSPSRTWTGGVAGNHLGWCVANAGDVNGDGYADALVGAPDASAGQAGEGIVYFFPGSSTGVSPAPALTLEANIAGAQFGKSVAGAGDVNGDGYCDVIVGAPLSGGTGAAYIYLGGPGGLSAVPSLTLTGTAASRFGASVSTAGDINADGRSEVLVGAPDANTVYLHLGSSSGTVAAPANTLSQGALGSLFGASVATAGDVNGDGYSDIIIGAPGFTNGQAGEGAAFVYHGYVSGLVTPFAIQLEQNLAGASFGCSVAGAGDVNGNGFFEVVVGAELWESGQIDEGGVFLYYGTSAGTTTVGAVTLQRNQAGMQFGHAVAEAGDVNGDGYADIVIGAPLCDAGHTDEGQVLVYRGSTTGLVTTLPDLLEPNATNYQAGWGVSGGGDVDGDGFSDVLIGAPQASPVSANEGTGYWFRGGLARGLSRYTRQYDADLVTPMSTNSEDYANLNVFGVGHRARSFTNRTLTRLRWEIVFEGQSFSGSPITNSVTQTGISAAWTNMPVAGQELKELLVKVSGHIRYKWRVREEYQTNKMIDGQRFSRWFYGFAAGHGDIGVLPIELLSFTGEAAMDVNNLYWITATENNTKRFDVQRLDVGGFTTIGSVDAAGVSVEEVAYRFTDAAPPVGIAYYRLRAVDFDGSEKISDMISIAREMTAPILYPDPATDELNVAFGDLAGAALLRVIDATGRTMLEQHVDPTSPGVRLVTTLLASGTYFVQVIDAAGRVVRRAPFVKR